MERIVLEVDDAVGKIYLGFNEESKRRFNETISIMIKKAKNDATFDNYSKFLDELSNEALQNGLTADVLETLLATND